MSDQSPDIADETKRTPMLSPNLIADPSTLMDAKSVTTMPSLPFDVIRRIIHHRLALPDSVPEAVPLSSSSSSTDSTGVWDELAGHCGGLAAKERQRERREVMRDAGGMMLVCKAWKVRRVPSSKHSARHQRGAKI